MSKDYISPEHAIRNIIEKNNKVSEKNFESTEKEINQENNDLQEALPALAIPLAVGAARFLAPRVLPAVTGAGVRITKGIRKGPAPANAPAPAVVPAPAAVPVPKPAAVPVPKPAAVPATPAAVPATPAAVPATPAAVPVPKPAAVPKTGVAPGTAAVPKTGVAPGTAAVPKTGVAPKTGSKTPKTGARGFPIPSFSSSSTPLAMATPGQGIGASIFLHMASSRQADLGEEIKRTEIENVARPKTDRNKVMSRNESIKKQIIDETTKRKKIIKDALINLKPETNDDEISEGKVVKGPWSKSPSNPPKKIDLKGKFSNLVGGKVGGGLTALGAGLDYYLRKQRGESTPRALGGAAASTLGGLLGGTAGAAGGTAIAPGVGTFAGGLTGGAAGFYAGGSLYDRAMNAMFGATTPGKDAQKPSKPEARVGYASDIAGETATADGSELGKPTTTFKMPRRPITPTPDTSYAKAEEEPKSPTIDLDNIPVPTRRPEPEVKKPTSKSKPEAKAPSGISDLAWKRAKADTARNIGDAGYAAGEAKRAAAIQRAMDKASKSKQEFESRKTKAFDNSLSDVIKNMSKKTADKIKLGVPSRQQSDNVPIPTRNPEKVLDNPTTNPLGTAFTNPYADIIKNMQKNSKVKNYGLTITDK